jgi:hypothetical protein
MLRLDSRSPRHRAVLYLIGCTYLLGQSARAQSARAVDQPNQSPKRRDTNMARFVPADVPIFVSTRHLDQLENALARTRAWSLLPIIAPTSSRSGNPLSLRRAVTSLLRAREPSIMRGVMRSELSLAATSWTGLSSAVWLLGVEDPRTRREWFPLNQRISYTKIGDAEYFKTRDGTSVCIREGIVALAREAGPGSMFSKTLGLMAGRSGLALSQLPSYRSHRSYLPPNHLAVAFLTPDQNTDATPPGIDPSWWTNAKHIVIGLFEGKDRLDIALRAGLSKKRPQEKLSDQAMQRFRSLPSTTLFAAVTMVDFQRALTLAGSAGSGSTLGRYLRLLASMPNANKTAPLNWPNLGPHTIVAWDQDFREGHTTPQAAIMLECSDGQGTLRQLEDLATQLVQLIQAIEPANIENDLQMVRRRHLGSTITSIPLRTYAGESSLPFMRVLANIEPAWTVSSGWLIIALSPEHLERILGAHIGLLPTLDGVPDVPWHPSGSTNRSMLSITQADLAAQHMKIWLAAAAQGTPSLLDPAHWSPPADQNRQPPPRLGIGMASAQEPGVVVVARVYPETAADGRLQVDDRILAIDGKLLSLTHPNADLRQAWLTTDSKPGPVARVSRGGTIMDIQLLKERTSEVSVMSTLRKSPADALRELASIAENIQFASLAVLAGDGNHCSARLSLRFTPTPLPKRR